MCFKPRGALLDISLRQSGKLLLAPIGVPRRFPPRVGAESGEGIITRICKVCFARVERRGDCDGNKN